MKALCWNGVNKLSVEQVEDPILLSPKDAIVRVVLSSACGSDLHLLDGYISNIQEGSILGHEFVGEVMETGSEVINLKKGDRVVVGSVIGCGECHYCKQKEWSLCDNSNPNSWIQEKEYGQASAGIFGYSSTYGGYAGSHAEYIRVPYADHGCFKIPDGVTYEQAIFTSDAFPTGYMAADLCKIKKGDIVAIWGCGGVGQMAIRSAYSLGAERVIAIDKIPSRLQMAREKGKAETLNFEEVNVLEALKEMTGGRGPDHCIDAVGMEAEGTGIEYYYDKFRQTVRLQKDQAVVLRQAITSCKKGGTISVAGIYTGELDKFPMGAAMNKALNFKMGQQFAQKYIPKLLEQIQKGEVDPSYLMTHKWKLEEGDQAYQMFKNKTDNCMRVVFDLNRGAA